MPRTTPPTAGSSPIAYALADRGARLLIQRDGVEFANVEWSRKNRKAGHRRLSTKGLAASALGPKCGTNRGMIIELDNPFQANIQRRPGVNAPGGL